jgi:hypothetical protein
MAYDWTTPSPGVLARHADRCPARRGGECNCGPIGYRAADGGHPTGPLVETEAQARAWGREQPAADLDAASTVAEAIDAFLASAADHVSAREMRELQWALEGHVAQALGDEALSDVRRRQLQALLARLERSGLSAARVEMVADALRALFDYALDQRLVDFSPADGLVVAAEERSRPAAERTRGAMVPDEAIWLCLKVATVVFVLIALILVAESV